MVVRRHLPTLSALSSIALENIFYALSVAVMISATALISGFKSEISRKIFEFWGHIHISDPRSVRSYEAIPFEYDTSLVHSIESIRKVEFDQPQYGKAAVHKTSKGGVHHVQAYIYLPGIISHDDQLEGIILKGIGKDYDWYNINQFRVTNTPWTSLAEDELIISHVTADRLRLKEGDKLILHFVREK
jgi:lipoprotein-releasing system permease protein